MRESLDKGDRAVSTLLERAARRISRREALSRTARGTAGALAAVAGGSLIGARRAFAADCPCGPTNFCANCPDGSNQVYCPPNRDRCRSSQCSNCPHGDGQWVSCTNCGSGQGSYRLCSDCRNPPSCDYCVCRSKCFCGGCLTFPEMVADMEARGVAAALFETPPAQ